MDKIKRISYIPFYGAPKKDEIFNSNKYGWEFALKEKLNKNGIEIHTDDIVSIKEADACLIFDNIFYSNLDNIWEMYHQRKLHNSVYIDYEPPTGHCKNHSVKGLKRLSKIFKYVVTYNDNAVDNTRIIKGNIANYYSSEVKKPLNFNKKKLLTMITNYINNDQIINILNYFNNTCYYNIHNTRPHKYELYSQRENAANYFLQKCPEKFDLYGDNWSNKFDLINKGVIEKSIKIKTLSKYKFIISYDSYHRQNGYISEKIFDAFFAKVVPVYWGANNITKYIPKDCFIDKRDFKTYDELYTFLINMSEDEYNKKIRAINKFLKSDTFNKYFSSEASANILKKCLTNKLDNFSYKKAYKNLLWFEKQKQKTQQKKKVNFYLSSWEQEGKKIILNFLFHNYNYEKNITFKLFANGIEINKNDDNFSSILKENRIEYLFSYEIFCDNFPIKIKLKYFSKEESGFLYFNDYNSIFSKQKGLFINKRKNTLIYYNKKTS